jgi:hypothetical protein
VEPDSRGAVAVLALGALMVAGVTYYAVTDMELSTVPLATPLGAMGLVWMAAGLLRLRRGRAVFDPDRLLEMHRQEEKRFGVNMLRIVAWLLDAGLCAISCAIVYGMFHGMFPRDPDSYYSAWAYDHAHYMAGSFKGMAYWRAAVPHMLTTEAQEIFGPFGIGLVISAFLFLPSVVWGGTWFMLAFRLKHLRSDGRRTGALHAVLRALAGTLMSPLQAALVLITLVLGTGGRYRGRGGGIVYGRHRIHDLAHARRNLADLICRTETLRLAKGWGRS